MRTSTAPEYWGSKAAEYDDLIRRVVPRYDEMTAHLMGALPDRARSILELGCGTGNLSLRLVRRDPAASFTFVDASAEMVELTRARIRAEHPDALPHVHFIESTFEDLAPVPDVYDAVVAGLSLHHVPDLGPVYRTVAQSMRRGGRFLSLDAVRAADEAIHAQNLESWHDFWRDEGNLTADEIASVTDHVARHDHYAPFAQHFEWLRAAGFSQSDCLWRAGLFAVISATRTG